MTRNARQIKILELITENVVETQDDLTRMLKEAGFNATQATILRDIKELGIVKVTHDGKKQKYVREIGDRSVSNKLVSIFKHAVVSIVNAGNIIVIKTISGSANIAGMMLDRLENPDILGCVAGDDTVMAVTKSESTAQQISESLSSLLEQ